MEPVKVTWQVDENTRGTWRDFPTDLNFLVDQAHKNRKPGVLYFWPLLDEKHGVHHRLQHHDPDEHEDWLQAQSAASHATR